MSKQYPGGIIVANPTAPAGPYETGAAPGIWTIDQAANYIKQGIWPTAGNAAPDAQFNYVTMLLHGDGTNGTQNNTFLDSGPNTYAITRNGNATQGSFSPYGSNWSNYFTGYSAAPTALYNTSAGVPFQVGTGDFTIEFWFQGSTQTAYAVLFEYYISGGASQLYAVQAGSDGISAIYVEGGAIKLTTSSPVFDGKWHHSAIVRNGSTVTYYVDGVSAGTYSTTLNVIAGNSFRLGNWSSGTSYEIKGYLSNFRFVKGTAVYTSSFTPPTSPLTAISGTQLLTCQSNRFIDNSSNAFALTVSNNPTVQRFSPFGTATAYSTATFGGSAYCDGSGDYLSFTEQTLSGDFTLEGWFYPTNPASGTKQQCLFGGTSTNTQLCIDEYNYGGIGYYNNGVRFDLGRYSGAPYFYHFCWNHFAYVKSGTTVTLYINGVSQAGAGGSVTDAGTFPLSAVLGNVSYGLSFLGYANIRVSTTARYSANFTPSTTPWTSDGSTKFLLQMTNGAIYDNSMMNDLETVGNAQISTSVVKYGTGSLAFDGTGDYLITNAGAIGAFGISDFTIEMWVYFNNLSDYQYLIDFRPDTTNGAYITLQTLTGTNNIILYANSGNQITSATNSISAGSWIHVALCRASGSTRLFINGTQSGSTYADTTNYLVGPRNPVIAANAYTLGTYCVNGYIDDLRITKGYARYTTTFTPPTSAFSNIGPT